MSTRLQSSRLLLCRGNRRFSGYVARQSQRPQPRGLFTRGQTGCLVFGRCFLTVQQPLFLLLENRFGSIACLMSVDIQRRYSFAGGIHPTGSLLLFWRNPPHRTDLPEDRMPSAGPDAVCRCGVGQLNQRRSGLFVPRRTPVRILLLSPCNVSRHSALPFQAAFYGGRVHSGGCHVIELHRTGRQPALFGL
jgi:hypothetical protein